MSNYLSETNARGPSHIPLFARVSFASFILIGEHCSSAICTDQTCDMIHDTLQSRQQLVMHEPNPRYKVHACLPLQPGACY